MRVFTLLIMAFLILPNAQAQTGVCFLDMIIGFMDWIRDSVSNFGENDVTIPESTSTTTISTSSSTTSSTSSSSTSSSTTITTSSTTSTTVFQGECIKREDCPLDTVIYRCNFEGNVVRVSTVFFCENPGPDSMCKSRQTERVIDFCQRNEKCVDGEPECI